MRVSGAIPERVVVAYEDALGQPVDVSSGTPLPTSGGGGGGSQVKILDADGNLITAANPFPVADNNSGNLLLRILQMLMAPLGYDKSLQRQRGTVVVESGTVTTVSTVTTVTTVSSVTNIAAVGGYSAQMQIMDTNRTAWALCVRARIT